jgi:hypothetical protein
MIIQNKIAFYTVMCKTEELRIREDTPNTVLVLILESHMRTLKNISESIKKNKFSNVSVSIQPEILIMSLDGKIHSSASCGNVSIALDVLSISVYSKNIFDAKIEIKL